MNKEELIKKVVEWLEKRAIVGTQCDINLRAKNPFNTEEEIHSINLNVILK